MRTTRITPEAMGWDTRSHAWNDVAEFFEDAVHSVDPWEATVKLHQNYVLPEHSWLDAATYTRTHVETSVQRLDKMEAQMGTINYDPAWRLYVYTPDGVERYNTTSASTWNMADTLPTTGTATRTTSFYELAPEELTTKKPVQAKDADEWEPATDEELSDMLGAE